MTDHALITTRIALPTDVDSVARIAHDAYEHYTSRIGRSPAPMTADYPDLISRGTVWVAQAADQMLGLLVLLDRPDHLLLDNIAVGPEAQGRGVGALLLELAEREAHRLGHDEVRLYTNAAMTENLDYYPRRGYRETHRGEQDGYQRVYFTKTLTAATP